MDKLDSNSLIKKVDLDMAGISKELKDLLVEKSKELDTPEFVNLAFDAVVSLVLTYFRSGIKGARTIPDNPLVTEAIRRSVIERG